MTTNRIERTFASVEEYNEYAKYHHCGDYWEVYLEAHQNGGKSGTGYRCYEYDHSREEYEAKKIEKALEKADSASVTAKFLGGEALIGTPKQMAWAEQIRADKLSKVTDQKVLAKLLRQTAAKFWIDNKDLSVTELAKKRLIKAKVQPVEKPVEQQSEPELSREEKLEKQSAIIAEKIAQFGEQRIKTDLFDALLGNQSQVEAVLAGTSLMSADAMKSFLTYAQ